MRLLVLALSLASSWIAAEAQTFEVASIKPAAPAQGTLCSGGPGTDSPGIWRCSNIPLWFLITHAYDWEAYQFHPSSPCCLARFDITATVPKGASTAQFRRMLQNLLTARLHLAFHHEQKEMPVFELTVAPNGPKLKEAPADAVPTPDIPWVPPSYTVGKDGYPVFPSGRGGLAGAGDHYRWTGFALSMSEIVKTLSFHLGRPVIDATGLQGRYDIDLRWGIDSAALLEGSGHQAEIGDLPDTGPLGPPLTRAVQNQLGLKLTSRKGTGDIVIIDHVDKVPIEN